MRQLSIQVKFVKVYHYRSKYDFKKYTESWPKSKKGPPKTQVLNHSNKKANILIYIKTRNEKHLRWTYQRMTTVHQLFMYLSKQALQCSTKLTSISNGCQLYHWLAFCLKRQKKTFTKQVIYWETVFKSPLSLMM